MLFLVIILATSAHSARLIRRQVIRRPISPRVTPVPVTATPEYVDVPEVRPRFQPIIVQEPDPEENAPAHYHFQYAVNEESTGDVKSQEETREDNEVRGTYSVLQPDGLLRIVEYSDVGNGFNAVVRYVDPGIRFQQPAYYGRASRFVRPREPEPILTDIETPVESRDIVRSRRRSNKPRRKFNHK